MKTTIKLVNGELPKLVVIILDEKSGTEMTDIISSFCYFRHYDWCWNWDDGDYGFSGGMDICNQQAFELPYGDKPSYETIIRVSLAAAIERWRAQIICRAHHLCDRGLSQESIYTWEGEVTRAFQVAKPAFEALAKHAVENPSHYFEAVARHDTRGGRLTNTKVFVEGFTPESCWKPEEAITSNIPSRCSAVKIYAK